MQAFISCKHECFYTQIRGLDVHGETRGPPQVSSSLTCRLAALRQVLSLELQSHESPGSLCLSPQLQCPPGPRAQQRFYPLSHLPRGSLHSK